VLIRNLDNVILADYHEALQRTRPPSATPREALLAKLAAIRDMAPVSVEQTPGWKLIREDRDC